MSLENIIKAETQHFNSILFRLSGNCSFTLSPISSFLNLAFLLLYFSFFFWFFSHSPRAILHVCAIFSWRCIIWLYMSRVSSEMPSLVHNSLSIFIGPNIRVQKNYPHDFHALCLSMRKAMKQEMCPILFVAPLLVSSESFPIVPFNLSNIP